MVRLCSYLDAHGFIIVNSNENFMYKTMLSNHAEGALKRSRIMKGLKHTHSVEPLTRDERRMRVAFGPTARRPKGEAHGSFLTLRTTSWETRRACGAHKDRN